MPDFYKQKGSDDPWTIVTFLEVTPIFLDGIPIMTGPNERLAFNNKGEFKFMNEKQFSADFEPVEGE